MNTTLKALLVAATVALPTAGAVSAQSDTQVIGMGHSMLVGSLMSSLAAEGIPSEGIENLTLTEVVTLRGVLSSDDTQNQKKAEAMKILDAAKAR